LQEQVTFTSDVGPHEEVFALMKASRVFVLPSVREGFGIAVAEALACGLPVVTTNAADNLSRLLVTGPEDGYLCDPEPQALARALEQALAGSPDRATGRARSRGTDRSWQAVGLGTVEVYDACLAM
jgi:glycosyltransferase involved in cell wall biosynthesis